MNKTQLTSKGITFRKFLESPFRCLLKQVPSIRSDVHISCHCIFSVSKSGLRLIHVPLLVDFILFGLN